MLISPPRRSTAIQITGSQTTRTSSKETIQTAATKEIGKMKNNAIFCRSLLMARIYVSWSVRFFFILNCQRYPANNPAIISDKENRTFCISECYIPLLTEKTWHVGCGSGFCRKICKYKQSYTWNNSKCFNYIPEPDLQVTAVPGVVLTTLIHWRIDKQKLDEAKRWYFEYWWYGNKLYRLNTD